MCISETIQIIILKNHVVTIILQFYLSLAPSRDIDRPKPWEEDEFDRGSLYRSSGGKLQYYAPPPLNYNGIKWTVYLSPKH